MFVLVITNFNIDIKTNHFKLIEMIKILMKICHFGNILLIFHKIRYLSHYNEV